MHLLTALIRNWKTVAMWPFLCSLAAGVIILVVPAQYTAEASFVVEEEEAGGGAAGLAGLDHHSVKSGQPVFAADERLGECLAGVESVDGFTNVQAITLARGGDLFQRLGQANTRLQQHTELMIKLGAPPEAVGGLDQGGHILPGSRA